MKISFDSLLRRWIQAETWPSDAVPLPKIQWHRGWRGDGARENSTQSFREAAALGAVMCECDLRLTADQIPVVCHDPTLERVWGSARTVARHSLDELRESAPELPTLEDILRDKQGPATWNLELKSRTASDPLIRKSVEVVQMCQAEKRVLFSSFNPMALWLLQDYAPEIPRALLVSSDENDPDNAWWLRHMLLAPLLRVHMLNLQDTLLTDTAIAGWRKQGVPIAAWTVNEPHRIDALLERGVQSVITDLGPKALA